MKSRFLATLILAGVAVTAANIPAQAQTAPLDTTTFVVVGEGLAAGMANFGLSSIYQQTSFPNVLAKQMGAAFNQPLIQPPGIGDVVGYPGREASYPVYPQGTVRV